MIGSDSRAWSSDVWSGTSSTAKTLRWPTTFHRLVTAPASTAPCAARASSSQIVNSSSRLMSAGWWTSNWTKYCTISSLTWLSGGSSFPRPFNVLDYQLNHTAHGTGPGARRRLTARLPLEAPQAYAADGANPFLQCSIGTAML